MLRWSLFIVVLLAEWARSQSVSFGVCPEKKPVVDFDIEKYKGTWYENQKNRRFYFILDSGLKCVTETYEVLPEGAIKVSMNATQVLGGRPYFHEGTVKIPDPAVGKLLYTFKDLALSPTDIPVMVLATDYTSYSVVWSCTTRIRLNTQIAWVLTREVAPSDETISKALTALKENKISMRSFIVTNQKGCRAEEKKQ